MGGIHNRVDWRRPVMGLATITRAPETRLARRAAPYAGQEPAAHDSRNLPTRTALDRPVPRPHPPVGTTHPSPLEGPSTANAKSSITYPAMGTPGWSRPMTPFRGNHNPAPDLLQLPAGNMTSVHIEQSGKIARQPAGLGKHCIQRIDQLWS